MFPPPRRAPAITPPQRGKRTSYEAGDDVGLDRGRSRGACARRGGRVRAIPRAGAPWRFAGDRDCLRAAADPARAAAQRAPAGGFSARAGRHRRRGRRALRFPVRPQADDRQERDQRRLRAEADGGRGRGGEGRAMAAATGGDRHLARLSGHRRRAAGRRRGVGDPFRVRATTSPPARRWSTSTFRSKWPISPTGSPSSRTPNFSLERANRFATGNTPQATVDAALAARDFGRRGG